MVGGKDCGKSLIVAQEVPQQFVDVFDQAREEGRISVASDVDVKNLLELGRIIMEERVLKRLLTQHKSHLSRRL